MTAISRSWAAIHKTKHQTCFRARPVPRPIRPPRHRQDGLRADLLSPRIYPGPFGIWRTENWTGCFERQSRKPNGRKTSANGRGKANEYGYGGNP
jgi:hypothetical protein